MTWPNCPRILSPRSSMLLQWLVCLSSASYICLSKLSRANCQISSLIMDPKCPLPKVRVVQQMVTDVDASGDGFPYPTLRKTNSQLLRCMQSWPYEASNTLGALYHKVFSFPDDQEGQNSAPSTVCVRLTTLVRASVVHHLFPSAWLAPNSCQISKLIPPHSIGDFHTGWVIRLLSHIFGCRNRPFFCPFSLTFVILWHAGCMVSISSIPASLCQTFASVLAFLPSDYATLS